MMKSRIRKPSRIPFIKEDVYLIVEGDVDGIFLNKLLSFIDTKYNIRIRVANGNGNIPIQVNILKKVYSFSKIFVLYDLDGTFTVKDIKRLLKNKDAYVREEEIFFVNPCIEHLVVLCKYLEKRKFYHKKDYQPLLMEHYKIKGYNGNIIQMNQIANKITNQDFLGLLDNLNQTSSSDKELPSSNFGYFIKKISK